MGSMVFFMMPGIGIMHGQELQKMHVIVKRFVLAIMLDKKG
jgi:hypothetical protein